MRIPRPSVMASVCAALFLLAVAAVPASAGKPATQIQAQPLIQALNAFAEQTGLQLMYVSDLAEGRQSNGAPAGLSAEQTLRHLLEGTNLTFEFLNDRTVAIRAKERNRRSTAPSATQMSFAPAPMRVAQSTGSPVSQTKDAPAQAASTKGSDEMVVTGSHIKGENIKSAPKFEYTQDDMRRTGAMSVEQFLGTLPQNFGGGRNAVADRASISFNNVANNTNGTTANLRGLAVGSTLSLINGRRMAPLSVGSDFDISIIPMGAVERIDVVTDGASAIYGSDAIAGVMNFIMRDRYDGAETSLEWGNAAHSDFRQLKATQILGHSWSSGGAMFTYEYRDQDALVNADRDYYNPPSPDAALIDPETRHSAMASFNQDLGERLSLQMDAIYSTREGDTTQAFFVGVTQNYETEYYTVSPTLTLQLPADWSVDLAAVWGRSNEEIVALFGGQLFAFGDWNRFTSTDLIFNGSLFSTAAGATHAAFGATWRNEHQRTTGLSAGPLDDRDAKAAFGEFLMPLIAAGSPVLGFEEGQLSLAVRYEDYSGVGSSTDPRVGLSLSPAPGVNLRGTWGTSFKAPTLSLSRGQDLLLIFQENVPTMGNLLLISRDGSLPGLGPETGESWTAGVDWTPADSGFRLNFTYYDIAFDDRIASVAFGASNFILNQNLYGDFVIMNPGAAAVNALIASVPPQNINNIYGPFNPANVAAIVDFRIRNISTSKTSGMDLLLNYDRPAFDGDLNLSLNINRVTKFDNQALSGGPVADDLDVLYRPLDLRMRGGAAWTRGHMGLATFVNYSDDYRNLTAIPDEKVDSYLTWDVNLRYDFDADRGGVLGGVTLFFNVSNILDEEPPFISTPRIGNFYDGANADPYGRRISAGVTKKW